MKGEIIKKKYGDHTVLKNIKYNFAPGKMYAIMGPSGHGKTTFLNIISGVDLEFEGEIQYFENVYIRQDICMLENFSVYENVIFGLQECDLQRVEQHIEKLKLSKNKKVSKLSGGQRQRVLLLRAFISKAQYILLDEPSSSLDIKTTNVVIELLKEACNEGTCVIVSTHDRNLATRVDEKHYIKDDLKICSAIENKKVQNNNLKLDNKKYLFKNIVGQLFWSFLLLFISVALFFLTSNIMQNFSSDWYLNFRTMDSELNSMKVTDTSQLDKLDFEYTGYSSSKPIKIDLNNNEIENYHPGYTSETNDYLVDIRKNIAKNSEAIEELYGMTMEVKYKFKSFNVDENYIKFYGTTSKEYYQLYNLEYGSYDFINTNDVIIPHHLAMILSDDLESLIGTQMIIKTNNGDKEYNIIGIYDEKYSKKPNDIGNIYVKGESIGAINEIISADVSQELELYNKNIEFKNNYKKIQLKYDVVKLAIIMLSISIYIVLNRLIVFFIDKSKNNDKKVLADYGFKIIEIKKMFRQENFLIFIYYLIGVLIIFILM